MSLVCNLKLFGKFATGVNTHELHTSSAYSNLIQTHLNLNLFYYMTAGTDRLVFFFLDQLCEYNKEFLNSKPLEISIEEHMGPH